MGFFDDCDADERFLAWEFQHHHDPPTSQWHIYDFDQRSFINVKILGHDLDGKFAVQFLEEHIDDIPLDVVQVEVSDNGRLISFSSMADLDHMRLPAYPPITAVPQDYRSSVIHLASLVEVERLGKIVDLVTELEHMGDERFSPRRFVFKWHIHWKEYISLWHEMNCMMRLSPHPYVVSFDRLVLAKCGPDDQDRIVGFTMEYVAGGTWEKNKHRVFKLRYLEQLISAIDDLNLRLGIVHQDIAPDNLHLDASTDRLKIADFGFSASIGSKGYEQNFHLFRDRGTRDDVKGVVFSVYEIVTGDWRYNPKPLSTFPMADILDQPWTQGPQTQLDCPVQVFQSLLRNWVRSRAAAQNKVSHPTGFVDQLNWPALESLDTRDEGADEPTEDEKTSTANRESKFYRQRRNVIRLGERYLRWTRPAHNRVPSGKRVLGDGRIISLDQ